MSTSTTDIESLQKTEKDLLDNLETDPHLTQKQRQQLIEKINAITAMRINLYKSIKQSTAVYSDNLQQNQNTVIMQNAAMNIEETNLNETKKRLRAVRENNLQELRLVEINHYFSEKYADHAKAAKALIALFGGLIIIQFLYKSGIMPNPIYWALVILLTGYIAYEFWDTLLLMYRRNNMVYDQLDFAPLNPSSVPSTTTSSTSTSSDPWYKPATTCIGEACCTSDMVFDSTKNMCVTAATTSDPTTTTAKENFRSKWYAL
jgi:hypothetical protein